VACDQNEAALEACVDGIAMLTCEAFDAADMPDICDNVCLGNQLCDGVMCESDDECIAAACDPATSACIYPDAPDGTACGRERGACLEGLCAAEFACTEQGIRDAIAFGGGPNTFDCSGQTTVTTGSEIVIDNDVILDGEGKLIVSGGFALHRVFSVAYQTTAALRRIIVTGGQNDDGGGIRNDGQLTLTGCVVSNNWSSGDGGGILNSGRELHLEDSAVVQNTAQSGGGVFNLGSMTMTESVVSGNSAWSGGGLYNRGDLALIDSAVSSNTAHFAGGVGHGTGSLTVSGCTVSGNDATEFCGGGLLLEFEATLINSTVSGNVAAGEFGCGGGIAVYDSVTLIHVTVADNESSQPGSALFVGDARPIPDASVLIRSSIIEGECEFEVPEAVRSGGHNVESPSDTCGFAPALDQVSVDPGSLALGPLSDNGGPTETHALQPGSVAMDQIPAAECVGPNGEPLTTDQRGEPRPAGPEQSCDSGAFEAQP